MQHIYSVLCAACAAACVACAAAARLVLCASAAQLYRCCTACIAAGYCAYDYLVDQAKPLELLRALLDADKAFGATQKQYQQAYQRLCAAVKRAQRYPALGCNCRTCNSVVEVRATEAEAAQTLKAQIGCVALVRAVQAGGGHCLDAMKLLHERGALLDGQDQDGRTALHQAIRYNRLPEARWLVSAGAHLDVPDFEGLLPLHQAACTGNVEFARLLVEAGAPINLHTVKYITQESLEAQTKKQDTGTGGRKAAKKRNALDVTGLTTIGGNSALALAVRHGHAAVVDYLLQQGAQFDLKNPADSSAFHAALDRGAATVASKLLSHLNKPKTGKGMAPAAPPAVATASSTNGVLSTVTRVRFCVWGLSGCWVLNRTYHLWEVAQNVCSSGVIRNYGASSGSMISCGTGMLVGRVSAVHAWWVSGVLMWVVQDLPCLGMRIWLSVHSCM